MGIGGTSEVVTYLCSRRAGDSMGGRRIDPDRRMSEVGVYPSGQGMTYGMGDW